MYHFRRLLNGMFDRHWAEITVMQFTGPSLLLHQFVAVPWDFNPVLYSQPSSPTPMEYALPPSLEWHVWRGRRPIYNNPSCTTHFNSCVCWLETRVQPHESVSANSSYKYDIKKNFKFIINPFIKINFSTHKAKWKSLNIKYIPDPLSYIYIGLSSLANWSNRVAISVYCKSLHIWIEVSVAVKQM